MSMMTSCAWVHNRVAELSGFALMLGIYAGSHSHLEFAHIVVSQAECKSPLDPKEATLCQTVVYVRVEQRSN